MEKCLADHCGAPTVKDSHSHTTVLFCFSAFICQIRPRLIKIGHMGSYRTIRGQTGQYGAIRDHMGPYRTMQDQTGQDKTIQDYKGAYGSIRDHTGPSGTILFNQGPFRPLWDHTRPQVAKGSQKGPYGAIPDNSGSYRAIREGQNRILRNNTEPYRTLMDSAK